MKSGILALALAGCFGGAIHASTVVSCGWSQTALNSCNGTALPSFTSQLDWAAFGVDGAPHTGLWTAPLTNGMTITVSSTNLNSGEGARTGVNYGNIYYAGSWYSSIPAYTPAQFMGHFDAATTPYTYDPANFPVGVPGDHLMGLGGAGAAGSTTKSLIIDFGTSISDLAFRIAAVNLSSFNVTLTMYSGANGTGAALGLPSTMTLTGGGNCAGLMPGNGLAPTPCNDANLIAALNAVNARSIQIQTNDPSGFYISDVYVVNSPEPASFVLAGCGALLIWAGKKKFRKV